MEILKSTMRTREYVEKGENEGKDACWTPCATAQDGMQYFDGEIERLVREGVLDMELALTYATNAGNLRLSLADLADERESDLQIGGSAKR